MTDDKNTDLSLFYEYIGGFVVAFEETCGAVRFCITQALHGNGLKDTTVAQAVTADLTAAPLHKMLLGLSGIAVSKRKDDHLRRVSKELLKRYQELIGIRNELLHSRWHINEVFFQSGKVLRIKEKNASEGLRSSDKVSTRIELPEIYLWIKEAEELTSLFLQMQGYLYDTFLEINGTFRSPELHNVEQIQKLYEQIFVFREGELRSTSGIELIGRFVPKHEST